MMTQHIVVIRFVTNKPHSGDGRKEALFHYFLSFITNTHAEAMRKLTPATIIIDDC